MKYRKKPVVIDAIQWTGKNIEEIENFCKFNYSCDIFSKDNVIYDVILTIHTLEGNMKANVGDYIIKGIQDEFYPCKPDIFESSYELVED